MANPLGRKDYRETSLSAIPDFDQILIGQALTSAPNLADLRVESAGRTYYQVRVEQTEYLIIDTIMRGCLESYYSQIKEYPTLEKARVTAQPANVEQVVDALQPALSGDDRKFLVELLNDVKKGVRTVEFVDGFLEISTPQSERFICCAYSELSQSLRAPPEIARFGQKQVKYEHHFSEIREIGKRLRFNDASTLIDFLKNHSQKSDDTYVGDLHSAPLSLPYPAGPASVQPRQFYSEAPMSIPYPAGPASLPPRQYYVEAPMSMPYPSGPVSVRPRQFYSEAPMSISYPARLHSYSAAPMSIPYRTQPASVEQMVDALEPAPSALERAFLLDLFRDVQNGVRTVELMDDYLEISDGYHFISIAFMGDRIDLIKARRGGPAEVAPRGEKQIQYERSFAPNIAPGLAQKLKYAKAAPIIEFLTKSVGATVRTKNS